MLDFKRIVFLCFFINTIVWSDSSLRNHFEHDISNRIRAFSSYIKSTHVGTTHYVNSGGAIAPVWEFKSRDTIICDFAGNEILRKISSAHSGWNGDSLKYVDSIQYHNGKVVESVWMASNRNPLIGIRSTYNYYNDDQSVVRIQYSWDDSLSTWILVSKDSSIFSTPFYSYTNELTIPRDNFIIGNYEFARFWENFNGFSKEYYYHYVESKWKLAYLFQNIADESNSQTLVYTIQEYVPYSDTIFDNYKHIIHFNSPTWSFNNRSEHILQLKNKITNAFENHYKYSYTYDTNITFTFKCRYDSSSHSWDTLYCSRDSLIYDGNDNNIIRIKSIQDILNGKLTFSNKDVLHFKINDIPVVYYNKPDIIQDVSITVSNGFIRISAPNITSMELYDLKGCLVTSVKQPASSAITLHRSKPDRKITSGSYMAKLAYKNVSKFFPLIVKPQ